MRVWGMTTHVNGKVARLLGLDSWHQQARVIFGGTQKAMVQATGETVGRIGTYGSPTGNAVELEMAARYPGVALATHLYTKAVWVRLDTEEVVS